MRAGVALCFSALVGASAWLFPPGAALGAAYDSPLLPLVYHGRPLTQVIEDIQPYTRRRILIEPAVAGLQYSGIVKQEDVDAWIRDLPAIYPVAIVDCQTSTGKADPYICEDPSLIVIRSRLNLYQNSLRSAQR